MVQIKEQNAIPKIIAEMNKLSKMSINVGVFGEDDSFMVMLATVHEFGAVIRPKKQYLTIPLKKKYRGKNPRDFDLFFLRTKEGNAFLVRNKGKDELEFAYMLTKEVNIPERSFLRSTFDEKNDEWYQYSLKLLREVIAGKTTAHEFGEKLGAKIQRDIQRKMRDMSSPPNAPSTVAMKGANNPLIDSGRLRQSVTYKVVM